MPILFWAFDTFNEDWFLVFGMPNAKKLAFGTPDANVFKSISIGV